MKILEGLIIVAFMAGIATAENIPLCAVCFGISFLGGFVYKVIWARGMKK